MSIPGANAPAPGQATGNASVGIINVRILRIL